MKRAIVFTTIGLIVVNLLVGMILSSYHNFNMVASSLVILLTGCLNYAAATVPLIDAYRVTHLILFSILSVVMFLLMVFSPPQMKDNWCAAVSLVIVILEAISLYFTYKVCHYTNK